MRPPRLLAYFVVGMFFVACKTKESVPVMPPPSDEAAPPTQHYDGVARTDFNIRALDRDLPLFWADDDNGNGALDPDELAVLWRRGSERRVFVVDGAFTPTFNDAYTALSTPVTPQGERQQAVMDDLHKGRPSLVASDFRDADDETKSMLGHLVQAADLIEKLYAMQEGSFGMDEQIPASDTLSRSLFRMNHGPWCSATGSTGLCNALEARPPHISGLYPREMQASKDFCAKLNDMPERDTLMAPFNVVVNEGSKLAAIPFNVHYQDDMTRVAEQLTAAANTIGDPNEAALKTYLLAAAKAFTDNNWFAADEAWAAMNADNSKWYVRIGPDEVYFEPCSRKGGFHLTLARINPSSKAWQEKLTPLRAEMEKLAAQLAGPPYKMRDLAFHMPDFIDIVINAGDDRSPRGATVGQSLPNFGPVGEGGRGRTVVMVNLYADTDNKAALKRQAASLLCPTTMSAFTDDPQSSVMATVLHEATHNLGPAQGYRAHGKDGAASFGGPTASMLEELKAQTGAMVFTDWLVEKGVIDPATAQHSHVREVLWMFGHIARGMFEPDGKPRPYSQLSAVQAGTLVRDHVLTYKADGLAANGADTGCFEIDLDKYGASARKLGHTVFGIKSRGDAAEARALEREFIVNSGAWKQTMELIGERWRREPQASFVYAVRVD